ncbi:MAG: Uma2 family endonuclease [Acidobacteria bacterium]|nr:Uma2 family endonuclease [Acidobacteriota bacterium]
MVTPASLRYTYSDYLAMPEEKRYELLDGELLVTPSPTTYHQMISRRIEIRLCEFVELRNLGEVLDAPCDVRLSDEDVVQPDILFVCRDRRGIIGERAIEGAPDFVVEILSASTESRDRGPKLKLYARHGVRELWLVDPREKRVEIHELIAGELRCVETLEGTATAASRVLSGFSIPLERIF